MIMTSGSCSADRDEMHGVTFCLERENLGCHIFESPVSQGSKRIVKELRAHSAVGRHGSLGRKVRRNDVSALRCLIVKDIFESLDDAIEELSESHSSPIEESWFPRGEARRSPRLKGAMGGCAIATCLRSSLRGWSVLFTTVFSIVASTAGQGASGPRQKIPWSMI
jgi:hypothetical protein